ncbi:MAG: TetR family transcriptional regulator [Proteobacteria bacterium]|nr:TetR family transcriptional regulator [Pseudomonadota bacterium]
MSRDERKTRILRAARHVFAEKGLQGASIAEIARRAEVNDSVIYQFFKGKEDLLFSVPYEGMLETIAQLELSLEGIRDATSLLSRFIWFQLRRGETDPEFSRVLILECRSQKDFYQSPAYNLIRSYSGILQGVLESGIKTGLFREDLNISLTRDVIFGTLDFEDISFQVTREIESPTRELDDVLDLILPMIQRRPWLDQPQTDKADRILSAAERIFAEQGFAKAKVSEIARMAGVSEGTVYEYFASKEALLFAIPAARLRDHMDRVDEAFEVKTPLRKLRRLIRNHFSFYLTNRNFLKVFLLHIQLSAGFYTSTVYETLKRYYRVIEGVIEEGKAEGSFRPDLNARVFRNLFLGSFSHMAIRWFIIGSGPETDMMKEIDEITDMISLTVLTEEALKTSGIGLS